MVSRPDPEPSECFAAIDFETANAFRTSACSVGIVRVEDGRVVAAEHRLIRPPAPEHGPVFTNSWVHGISWEHVAGEPTFGEVWPELRKLVRGVDFIAAHNAPFDRGVLRACCAMAEIPMTRTRFECTVKLARSALNIYPTKLHQVCGRLGIPLRHHHALSDAEACARIVLAARAAQGATRSVPAQDVAAIERVPTAAKPRST